MIRSAVVYALTAAYTLVVGPALLLYAAVTGDTDPVYKAAMCGVRLAMWLAGVRVEVHGREKILGDRAAVYMPNHQSNSDPPAVIVNLPPVLVLVKKEFFRVPILRQAMRIRGFISVDRGNREKAIEAIKAAVRALQAGHSFLAFPEGTRSSDGRLQRFKKGVFLMAIEAGAPIVPISVSGSNKIMRKGDWRLKPGLIRVTIHDPVPTQGCNAEDRDTIMSKVREAIASGLAPDEQPIEFSARYPQNSAMTPQPGDP
jgi:1-acyl-sn-glycerol-3-phosphate acyltransferase